MTTRTHAVADQLVERGKADVSFPLGRAELTAIAGDFLDFLGKPRAEKES